jgi:hypothetical protein
VGLVVWLRTSAGLALKHETRDDFRGAIGADLPVSPVPTGSGGVCWPVKREALPGPDPSRPGSSRGFAARPLHLHLDLSAIECGAVWSPGIIDLHVQLEPAVLTVICEFDSYPSCAFGAQRRGGETRCYSSMRLPKTA